jgi:hypothetical protein
MMRCRAPALITLPALLGLLHTAALADAEPPPEVTPRTGRGPTAPDVDLKATLDELTARVQQLSQRAGATAELAETVMGATQRLAQFEEAAAAEAIAVRQLLAATRDRIADLDAARAKDGAMIARLQAELDAARAEGERPDLPRVAAAPAEEGGPGACDGSVEVESGDTLDAIARRCKTTVDALMKANPDIKDPRRILVGQKIALPVS